MLANSGSTSQQSSSAVIASSNSSLASVAKSVVTHEVKAPKSSIMELMITDLRQLLEIRKVEFQKLLNLRRAGNYESIDICSTEIQALLQLHPDIIDPKTCLLNSNIWFKVIDTVIQDTTSDIRAIDAKLIKVLSLKTRPEFASASDISLWLDNNTEDEIKWIRAYTRSDVKRLFRLRGKPFSVANKLKFDKMNAKIEASLNRQQYLKASVQFKIPLLDKSREMRVISESKY